MVYLLLKKAVISLLCIAGTSGMLMTQALAANNATSEQLQEAAMFYKKLAQSSDNPVIVDFSLERVKQLEKKQTPQKETVVQLLSQVDNSLVIPVMLNKTSLGTFIVDTGASYTVITPRLAKKMNITVTPDTPKISIVTVNGVVEAPLVTVDSLTIGGIEVKNVKALIQPLGNNDLLLAGLLGMNAFQGMNMTIKQGQLILSMAD